MKLRFARADIEFLLLGLVLVFIEFLQWITNPILREMLRRVSGDLFSGPPGGALILLFLKLLLAVLALIFILARIKRAFRLPFGVTSFAVTAYSFLFCLVYYPFLLENYPLPNGLFSIWDSYKSDIYLKMLAVFILAGLLVWTKLKLGLSQILALVLMAVFFCLNNPYLWLNSQSFAQSKAPPPGSIFVIGVDSMNRNALDGLNLSRYPALKAFLASAKKYENVQTNIARTFPSYISFLSGKPVTETEIRGAFMAGDRSTDEILQNSLAEDLVRKGYDLSVTFNDYSFAQFDEGRILAQVAGPASGFQNNVLTIAFHNFYFFGLLNNIIGQHLFPEIVANGASADTYFPQYFLPVVKRELNRFDQGKPFLKIAHLVKAHWPYSNQYPYYRKEERSRFTGSAFKSASAKDFYFQQRFFRLEDELADERNYHDSILQIVENYLEPLFKYLESDEYKNLTVIFLSDHGENLRFNGWFPRGKVGHGDWAGFNDRSDQVFLAIKPAPPFSPPNSDLSVFYDILPSLFDQNRSLIKPARFTESDRALEQTLPGQIYTATIRNNADFKLSKTGMLSYPEEANEQQLSVRTRKILSRDGSSLTVFPSKHGFQLFFDGAAGFKQKADLISLFNQTYQTDIEKRRIPLLKLKIGQETFADFEPISPMDKVFRGLELFYRKGDLIAATNFLREAISLDRASMQVKIVSVLELGNLCVLGALPTSEFTQLAGKVISETAPANFRKAKSDIRRKMALCMHVAGKEAGKPQLAPKSFIQLSLFDEEGAMAADLRFFQSRRGEFPPPLTAYENVLEELTGMRQQTSCDDLVEAGIKAVRMSKKLSLWNFAGMSDPPAAVATGIALQNGCIKQWSSAVTNRELSQIISKPLLDLIQRVN